ncbi:MAG: aldolase [Acidisphaera sp.]|nr:aldolase [Acidisphaera sp.]
MTPNTALRKMREGELAIGFGVHHLRSAATPMLARAAGFDWLFIDTEHGAFSVQEATQLCLAALPTGVTPIVRVCSDALDEGTRALDNGAMGIVVPHVDTVEQARRIVAAFRYPPVGHRSWGGPPALYGFSPPPVAQAQAEINREVLVCAMIETPQAVDVAGEIAAVDGIDALMIGTSDLSAEMGISGQMGHPRVQEAYAKVGEACRKSGKFLGMGGVYDEQWAATYIGMGVRIALGGADHALLMAAATARTAFMRGIKK